MEHSIRYKKFGCVMSQAQYFKCNIKHRRGFTLIELLVVVAISTIITGAVLAQNGQFDDRVALNNLTHEIALTVRKAQVVGSNSASGQGIRIDVDPTDGATEYKLYTDRNHSGRYDGASELLDTLRIGRGSRISDICLKKGGRTYCTDSSLRNVDITFRRPAQSAQICTNSRGCDFEQVEIILTGIRGGEATMIVYASGQIQVE
jgi:prepilin-type N-terminal cleavage/methylation domain-containing protein